MDREKVIGALIDGRVKAGRMGLNAIYIDFETIDKIINLLKEPDAVKPYIDIDEAKCPVCKVKLTRQELIGDDVLFEDFFDYCLHCGKPILWGGR